MLSSNFSTNAHDAASAVAYCYCEEHKTLSTYFYHLHSWKIEFFGSSCGDWLGPLPG